MLALAFVLAMASAAAYESNKASIASTIAGAEYRPLVAAYARCIAALHRTEASEFALHKNPEWTGKGKQALSKLDEPHCIPSQAAGDQKKVLKKMTPDLLRPHLADALVRTEFPQCEEALIRNAQPLPAGSLVENLWPSDACSKCDPQQRKTRESARAIANRLMAPYVFGECAVRADTQGSHRLLMTEANSNEEIAAFNALAPAFGQCVTEGSQAEMSKANVRGLIALSYYRLAHAPRIAAAAGVTQ